MEPIVLVHGYSAESKTDKLPDVQKIFGSLPDDLRTFFKQEHERVGGQLAPPVVNINLSRYISLDDGVDLEDITLAFDRALRRVTPLGGGAPINLLATGFNAIIHSTGALVLRNWVRRCSPKPSPCKRIVHLAGANLGSGWAHIGETLLAKWARFIGEQGSERGLAVLDGLELGSNWALDLHRHFLSPGNGMFHDYQVLEFSLVGSQPPPKNLIVPFRYGKEDGSDGVVRVSASNLNYAYIRIEPACSPEGLDYDAVKKFAEETVDASTRNDTADFQPGSVFAGDNYYELKEALFPGEAPWRKSPDSTPAEKPQPARPLVPFAIPYCCAHSGADVGIVYGTETREQVIPLVGHALGCPYGPEAYAALAQEFDRATDATHQRAAGNTHLDGLNNLFKEAAQIVESYLTHPQAQYDGHAQVIVRVRDQNGRPVEDVSIHFNSFGGGSAPKLLMNALFEDTHTNKTSPDTTTFYLRLLAWDKEQQKWADRLAIVDGVDLEIDAIDPKTQRIVNVPLRMRLPADKLARYLKPHRTLILDVELLRLPSRDTFALY